MWNQPLQRDEEDDMGDFTSDRPSSSVGSTRGRGSKSTPLTSPTPITPNSKEVNLMRHLMGRITATSQLTPKEKLLQSLYDTISAWMMDYTETEFVELSKCVGDKLYAICQTHLELNQGINVPQFQPTTGALQHAYQGYHLNVGPAPSTPESSSTDALQRQIASLQKQLQDASVRREQVSTPRSDLNLSLGSFGVLSPPRPQDHDKTLHTPNNPVKLRYHQL